MTGLQPSRLNPRRSLLPAILAVLLGLAIHAVDQWMAFRAGPVPILLAAPATAVLVYVYGRPATGPPRVLAVFAWGVIGSGAAILVVYLQAVSYQLPRPLTGPEMVWFDLGLFLWFVGALTAAYAVAARLDGSRAVIALVAGPLAQAAVVLVVVLLAETGLRG